MILAALETSTRRGGVALSLDSGKTVSTTLLDEKARHASTLLPTLGNLLEQAGKTIRDLELLAVDVGPGSYTGLRVGIATALGLGSSGKLSLVGVSSTRVLAAAAPQEGTIAIVQNAYGGEVYLEVFRKEGQELSIEVPLQILAPEGAEKILPAECTLLGDGIPLLPSSREAGPEELWIPHPAALLRLGQEAFQREGATDPKNIRPLYLRPSRAEIQRVNSIHGGTSQGLGGN